MDWLPTKRNLQLAKHHLARAKQGHELLEKKRKIIRQTFLCVKSTLSDVKSQFENAIKYANILLLTTKLEIDALKCDKICDLATDFDIPPYNLHESSAAVDEVFFAWQKAKILHRERIALELEIEKLALSLQKISKRAAALKNIIIPQYEGCIKYISEKLEDQERDELIRSRLALKRDFAHDSNKTIS